MKIRVKLSAKEPENVDVLNTEDVEKNKEIEALLDRFEKKAAEMPDGVLASYQEWDDFSEAAIAEKHREELVEQAESLEHIYESVAKKSYRASHWRSMAVYMLVVTTMASCVTFSKFITEVSGGGSGTVAAFDVGVYLGDYVFGNQTDSFELEFEEAKEDQPYTLTLKNNSDVTVKFVFSFTSSGGKHTFSLSGTGVSNNEVQIGAGKTSDVVLHFYGAEETVDETARLLIRAEQVD